MRRPISVTRPRHSRNGPARALARGRSALAGVFSIFKPISIRGSRRIDRPLPLQADVHGGCRWQFARLRIPLLTWLVAASLLSRAPAQTENRRQAPFADLVTGGVHRHSKPFRSSPTNGVMPTSG